MKVENVLTSDIPNVFKHKLPKMIIYTNSGGFMDGSKIKDENENMEVPHSKLKDN